MREREGDQTDRERKAWRIHSAPHHFMMFPLCRAFKASYRKPEKRSHRNSTHIHVCLTPSRLFHLYPSLPLLSPLLFLYLSLTKSLRRLFCWGLLCRETGWQRGVRLCRRYDRLSFRERVWYRISEAVWLSLNFFAREARCIWWL